MIDTGLTPDLLGVLRRAEKAARAYQSTIVLLGETGVGKTRLARHIHGLSPRSSQPFVTIDLSQATDSLFEDELFGHDRGGYTGATSARKSLFETADGGTVFLDEIGTVPLHLQVKLMRLAEEGKFRRIGGNSEIKVDVRLITATSHNLFEMVQQRTFREDLYYRLNTVQIEIPPLRQRPRDVMSLAEHFLQEAARIDRLEPKPLSQKSRRLLLTHEWPGNVRALRHAISGALIMSEGDEIEPYDFPFYNEDSEVSRTGDSFFHELVPKYKFSTDIFGIVSPLTKLEKISDIESEHAECTRRVTSAILVDSNFSIAGAAKIFCCSPNTLIARIAACFSLERQDKESIENAVRSYLSRADAEGSSAVTEISRAIIEVGSGMNKLDMIDDIFKYVKISCVRNALSSHGYVQVHAASAVGWDASTMSIFVSKNPSLKEWVQQEREKIQRVEKLLAQGAQPRPC